MVDEDELLADILYDHVDLLTKANIGGTMYEFDVG